LQQFVFAAIFPREEVLMSDTELRALADLLEKMIRVEKVELTESERRAAMKLVSAADQLADQRGRQ
jgi:hypothetical protein